MKIAVISDIHGNHFALDAVLQVAQKEGIAKFLILGDLVGYYYYPEKVLELLRQWDILMIKGNHEHMLLSIVSGITDESEIRMKYGSGHRSAIDKLSSGDLDWIRALPDQHLISVDGLNLLMCHGSPWDPNFYLYPNTDREILDECGHYGADFVLVGHSHHAFVAGIGDSILINAGSIGQSRGIGGLATWAIVNTKNKSVQMMSTPYSPDKLISIVKNVDPSVPYLADILLRNR